MAFEPNGMCASTGVDKRMKSTLWTFLVLDNPFSKEGARFCRFTRCDATGVSERLPRLASMHNQATVPFHLAKVARLHEPPGQSRVGIKVLRVDPVVELNLRLLLLLIESKHVHVP